MAVSKGSMAEWVDEKVKQKFVEKVCILPKAFKHIRPDIKHKKSLDKLKSKFESTFFAYFHSTRLYPNKMTRSYGAMNNVIIYCNNWMSTFAKSFCIDKIIVLYTIWIHTQKW